MHVLADLPRLQREKRQRADRIEALLLSTNVGPRAQRRNKSWMKVRVLPIKSTIAVQSEQRPLSI